MVSLIPRTEVTGTDGRYRASIHPELSTPLGPFGGYVAGIALRAAGMQSKFDRPVSFACHYLRPARFEQVDLEVATLRETKRAQSMQIAMLQAGEPILTALVWTAAELSGVEHEVPMPEVVGPEKLRPFQELFGFDNGREDWNRFIEGRPILDWQPDKEPPWGPQDFEGAPPGRPLARGWVRLLDYSNDGDAFLESARLVVPIDWFTAAAAFNPHRQNTAMWLPHMDLMAFFHDLSSDSDWMFVETESPVARQGLAWARAAIWSQDGRLLATGMQQMLQRVM